MSRTPKSECLVHVTIRPRLHEILKSLSVLDGVIAAHPSVKAEVVGIACESNYATLTIAFPVLISDRHPSSIAALKCLHQIFSTLFDYTPHYAAAPTAAERETARAFSEHRSLVFGATAETKAPVTTTAELSTPTTMAL